jgi:metal-responsive CopG/Arc/MetJ family transcriptional regulator
VAKVMISMPDELLARLDQHARAAGKTRSGLLQELTTKALEASDEGRQKRVEQLLDEITGSYGGRSVEWIREDRRRDDP